MTAFEQEDVPGAGEEPAGGEAPALVVARLYERHGRMVRALCQLLLRDPVEAEDAAQQTFLSAFGSLLDGTEPRNPAAWLATIARRECWARTAQRRHRALRLDEDVEHEARAADPLEQAIRAADLNALWHAINRLPRQQREAFLLREFSGLSYAEVAVALGASESAIESLLVRARRELRDGLEPLIRTANLLATPIVLLRHRLGQLLAPRGAAEASAGAAALIPVGLKVGATVAGAVAVVAGSVGVGLRVVQHGSVRAAPVLAREGGSAAADAASLREQVGRGYAIFPSTIERLLRRSTNAAAPGAAVGALAAPTGLATAAQADTTAGGASSAAAGAANAAASSGDSAEGSDGAASQSPASAADGSSGGSGGQTDAAATQPGDTQATDTQPTDTTTTDSQPAETPSASGSTASGDSQTVGTSTQDSSPTTDTTTVDTTTTTDTTPTDTTSGP